MLIELGNASLQEIIADNDTVLVQYSAGWCGNCRIMKPKFKKMAQENEAIPFVLVDAEKNPAARKLADVSNLPTFASFKKGALHEQVQTNKVDQLKTLVDAATSD
ncbi:MAG: thioredoxin family protein [Flavobacteriaceae bacterium]